MEREPRVDVRQVLRFAGVVMAMVLAFAAEARADADSVIVGTVVSADGQKPLSDVVVTVTSPALQDERTVVTNELGQYRLPELPPGIYSLRFEKEEFRVFKRPDVRLRPNRTIRINVELFPSDMEEGFQLMCAFPVVDVFSSTSGASFAMELSPRILLSPPPGTNGAVRSFERVAEWVPGARSDAYGASILGATAFENEYTVDGLSTRDPLLGVNALPVNVEFLEDIDVVTSGALPEYGRATGGTLRTQTRSGTNEFRGSVFASWMPGALEGTRQPVSAGAAPSQDALVNLGDFGATLGGPLVKDRMWFFAGVAPALSRVARTGDARTLFADQRGVQTFGKLTYLFNPDHNVTLSVLSTPAHSGGEGRLTVDRLTGGVPLVAEPAPQASGAQEFDSTATLTAFKYRGSFLDRWLLFDVDLGWLHQRITRAPSEEDTLDRYQARATSWYRLRLAGEHTLKAGVETEFLAHVPAAGAVSAGATGQLFGGYVQDIWTLLSRVTVNGGLRLDAQSLRGRQDGPAFTPAPALSPRLGVVVDPWADYRVKLFAHYGKSRAWVPLLAVESARGGPVDPSRIPRAFTEFVTGAEFEVPLDAALGATYTHRDLDSSEASLHRRYDGVTVSLRRTLGPDWMTQLSYTWSRLRGNYPGLLVDSAGQGEPGLLPGLDSPELVGREGLLPLDRTHSVKLIGSRQFTLTQELTGSVGAAYRGDSGAPVDGTTERTPWVHDLNVHADVDYRFDKYRHAILSLDVFNVFNAQAATQVARDSTSVPVALQYQPPRQVRLGARYTF